MARRGLAAGAGVLVLLATMTASPPPRPPSPTVAPPTHADPPLSSGVKPTAETTGVADLSVLEEHYGDIVVTEPGTVLENLDVHGFVTVEAADVTIRNSVVRGGAATYNRGLITNYGHPNLLVEDVDVLPAYDTVWQDGVKGSDFTLNRVYVTGNVDSVKIHGGGNVLIQDSLLENTVYHVSDPNQDGRPSHNDGVQVLDGANIRIRNSTIRGQQNFAVLGAANRGPTDLLLEGNWLDGGHCTVKLEEKNGQQLTATVTGNRFGSNRAVPDCVLLATAGSEVRAEGNTTEEQGLPVDVRWASD